MSQSTDPIRDRFLSAQLREILDLCAESDIAEVEPLPGSPPTRYVVTLNCRGLAGSAANLREVDRFVVGINLGGDYLRVVDQYRVLTMLDPLDTFHPNIVPPDHPVIPPGVICPGRIAPGMDIVSLVFQAYELITYHRYITFDSLNADACAWVRNHANRLPLDRRPLRRPRVACGESASRGEGR